MLFVYFRCKLVFPEKSFIIDYYNSYIYDGISIKKILNLLLHDIIVTITIKYKTEKFFLTKKSYFID